MDLRRFAGNPIIRPGMDERIGDNINGPSLIRVPEWVANPLGRYYLYFAHHRGTYIRLAYADAIEARWRIHGAGVLDLEQTPFHGHIASPDVHIDEDRREIRMYYHGAGHTTLRGQHTCVAHSADGLRFTSGEDTLPRPYWRVFERDGYTYALTKRGWTYRSVDPLTGFEAGPRLAPGKPPIRHAAVMIDADTLYVLYSRVGDAPERILLATVDLSVDWSEWRASEPVDVLAPETEYEGAGLPVETSHEGSAPGRVCQLRDPYVFQEDGRTYLLYSVAGEHGIAVASTYKSTFGAAGRVPAAEARRGVT